MVDKGREQDSGISQSVEQASLSDEARQLLSEFPFPKSDELQKSAPTDRASWSLRVLDHIRNSKTPNFHEDDHLLETLAMLRGQYPEEVTIAENWANAARLFVHKYIEIDPKSCDFVRFQLDALGMDYPGSSTIKFVGPVSEFRLDVLKQVPDNPMKTAVQHVYQLYKGAADSEKQEPVTNKSWGTSSGQNSSISFSSTSGNVTFGPPGVSTSLVEILEEKEKGNLLTEKEKRIRHLVAYLDAAKVPESEWAAFIEKVEIDLARVTRPKWVGRLERGGELAVLSAPLFLKRVHADYIANDGTVENETIRAIDPDLMRAVESYIANRKNRPDGDMGDAKDLRFILAHPGKGNPGIKARKPEF